MAVEGAYICGWVSLLTSKQPFQSSSKRKCILTEGPLTCPAFVLKTSVCFHKVSQLAEVFHVCILYNYLSIYVWYIDNDTHMHWKHIKYFTILWFLDWMGSWLVKTWISSFSHYPTNPTRSLSAVAHFSPYILAIFSSLTELF